MTIIFLSNFKRIAICLAICFYLSINAQTSLSTSPSDRVWNYNSINNNYNWNAQWIWIDENKDADVMLARRTFVLEQIPEEAILKITASSKYELYVNGKAVCQGPARCAPHHQSFDILKIKSLLLKGKNILAIRVHYQKGTLSYHLKGRAGLLAQLDMTSNETKTTISTDTNWKVIPDTSWDNNSPKINRFQLVVNDRVDLRKELKDWQQILFDDSNWKKALPLLRDSGWPAPEKNQKATALTTPWTSLIPRDIPYLKETDIKSTHLIEAIQLNTNNLIEKNEVIPENILLLDGKIDNGISKSIRAYSNNNKAIIVPPTEMSKSWLLLFDNGKIINGMPKLNIQGSEGTQIDILCAPFIVNNTFTHKIVDSDLHDQIILSGKEDHWQATYFKPTRYLAIVIKGNREAVKIQFVGMHQLKYPFEKKGSIYTPEAPWIEDLWAASAKTIETCTTDAYTDNYRERRQYAQTGYYASLGNYWSYGDTALQRRYLIQIAEEQEGNGIMPAYAPLIGDDYMIMLDSNCFWIRSLYNYYLFSGDTKTVLELLPTAKKIMQLFHSYTNSLGLLDNPPYAYWLDHALNDRQGANLCLNGHYLGALKDFSQLLKWLDDKENSVFEKRALLLKTTVNSCFWNKEKELFADAYHDGEQSKQFSEQGNAMALAEKIATPEQAELVVRKLLKKDNHNYIKREDGMTMVTPAMSYFLEKGLSEYGHEEASLLQLKDRFGKMIETGTNGTLWEEWWLDGTARSGILQKGRTRSDAQTESAFFPALAVEYVVGLKVSMPGMKEIIVSKPNTSLKHIDLNVPTPEGQLLVKWDLTNKNLLRLTVPGKMQVKIKKESLQSLNKVIINVNGTALKSSENNLEYVILHQGDHTITF
jgi:alpha-L-rhamnosidase